jgi:transposase-like protein
MSPRKLTEDDKQEILQLYRNSEATTSTLATNYDVSSSTISRFLKNKLSSSEYEDLIQQKRLARTPRGEKSANDEQVTITASNQEPQTISEPKVEPPVRETVTAINEQVSEQPGTIPPTTTESPSLPMGRRRRRSSGSETREPEFFATESSNLENSLEDYSLSNQITSDTTEVAPTKSNRLVLKTERVNLEDEERENEVEMNTLKEMLGEDLEDINDEDDEDDEDDWEDDEDDEDDYPTDTLRDYPSGTLRDREEFLAYSGTSGNLSNVQILPLSQASFPRTCYLVIDRSAELIVKPLADFADLGAIPQAEIKQKTLPVFDNHRIAKRFSHRRERVIKVPDGRMLQKTSQYLQEKGITRLLIDGRIYSL